MDNSKPLRDRTNTQHNSRPTTPEPTAPLPRHLTPKAIRDKQLLGLAPTLTPPRQLFPENRVQNLPVTFGSLEPINENTIYQPPSARTPSRMASAKGLSVRMDKGFEYNDGSPGRRHSLPAQTPKFAKISNASADTERPVSRGKGKGKGIASSWSPPPDVEFTVPLARVPSTRRSRPASEPFYSEDASPIRTKTYIEVRSSPSASGKRRTTVRNVDLDEEGDEEEPVGLAYCDNNAETSDLGPSAEHIEDVMEGQVSHTSTAELGLDDVFMEDAQPNIPVPPSPRLKNRNLEDDVSTEDPEPDMPVPPTPTLENRTLNRITSPAHLTRSGITSGSSRASPMMSIEPLYEEPEDDLTFNHFYPTFIMLCEYLLNVPFVGVSSTEIGKHFSIHLADSKTEARAFYHHEVIGTAIHTLNQLERYLARGKGKSNQTQQSRDPHSPETHHAESSTAPHTRQGKAKALSLQQIGKNANSIKKITLKPFRHKSTAAEDAEDADLRRAMDLSLMDDDGETNAAGPSRQHSTYHCPEDELVSPTTVSQSLGEHDHQWKGQPSTEAEEKEQLEIAMALSLQTSPLASHDKGKGRKKDSGVGISPTSPDGTQPSSAHVHDTQTASGETQDSIMTDVADVTSTASNAREQGDTRNDELIDDPPARSPSPLKRKSLEPAEDVPSDVQGLPAESRKKHKKSPPTQPFAAQEDARSTTPMLIEDVSQVSEQSGSPSHDRKMRDALCDDAIIALCRLWVAWTRFAMSRASVLKARTVSIPELSDFDPAMASEVLLLLFDAKEVFSLIGIAQSRLEGLQNGQHELSPYDEIDVEMLREAVCMVVWAHWEQQIP